MIKKMADLTIYADAGGSKTVARAVRHSDGRQFEVLGGGCVPSSGMSAALASIVGVVDDIVEAAGLNKNSARIRLALASAGIDDDASKSRFLAGLSAAVQEVRLAGDGEAALLGCVGDRDGAVVSVGTGVAAFARTAGHKASYDGWGWPFGDRGGGAHIGREAVAAFLGAMDTGEVATDLLYIALRENIGASRAAVFDWLKSANRKETAALAPLVGDRAEAGSPAARGIMFDAAGHILRLSRAIRPVAGDPVHLTGGAVSLIRPYLGDAPLTIVPDACLAGARHLAADWLADTHQ